MNTVFFLSSKVLGILLQPETWLLGALILVLWLLYRQRWLWARRLLLLLVALLVIVAVLPLSGWLFQPLEQRFVTNPPLPDKVDGIIVLGGFLDPVLSDYWHQVEASDSIERGLAFAELARRYPDARLVMSGGTGSLLHRQSREADVMPKLFRLLQLDPGRITLERDSRNTFENAENSKRLMQPKPGETWILVTSANHMPRAVGVFCQQGWPVLPWPVDHQWSPEANHLQFDLINNILTLNDALHEWFGLLAYHLAGKTDALFPAGCSHQS